VLQVAKKRAVERYLKAFRQMAVERLKSCDNIVALSKELGIHRRLLLQVAGSGRALVQTVFSTADRWVRVSTGTKLLRPNQYCLQSAPGQAAGVALRRLCLNKLAKPASSLEHLTAPTTGRRLTAYYLYPGLID